MRKCQIDSFGKGLNEMAGSCEHSCESFDSKNNGDFLSHWNTLNFWRMSVLQEGATCLLDRLAIPPYEMHPWAVTLKT